MTSKTVSIEYDVDSDEYLLPLGDEVCQILGWKIGDTVKWIDNQNGTWTIKKVENDQKLEQNSN